mmetsp:Transcript_7446/g.11282  ORF Transcript_7446/g.11282 Transcript_7446/m.11282 type:complete len:601 (+) Transcript_7446:841-2643(+)|eukprot:CAMPEP_0167744616 /NCGR_PEP_ID=MMETSP0110_2-20121227/2692_1 /TAXON_ID=629695 /ORGANISM="Gymnochlora sp., Strain CCMP2014" /LENGTH=600 /DNA_ID=CAMNT_0007629161 /DNA_START=817 /DNA_END=2619 /DNA_ORIENTATION=-
MADMFQAIEDGDLKKVESLLDNGEDVDMKDEYGNTALMAAVRSGNQDMVKLLCDNGADLSIEDSTKETALGIAKEEGDDDIVQILKGYGAGGGEEDPEDDGDGWGEEDDGKDGWDDAEGGGGGEGEEGWPENNSEGSGADGCVWNPKLQRYYEAEDVKQTNIDEALEHYRACVEGYEGWKEAGCLERLEDDPVELVMKSLVQQVSILLIKGETKEALATYERLFAFVEENEGNEGDLEADISRLLTPGKQQTESLLKLYDVTLRKLREQKRKLMWNKFSFKLSELYLSEGRGQEAQNILDDVHNHCKINGQDDPSKSDVLYEVYARKAELRLVEGTEDDKFLHYIFTKTRNLTSVPDAKFESVLTECWGKKYGNEGQWISAYKNFFTAMKKYQDRGRKLEAKRCMKYAVMANMLSNSSENPFEQKEGRALITADPEIQALTALRDAYQKCDIVRYNNAFRNLRPDWYLKKHISVIVRDFQERAICDLIRPYQRVRIGYLCDSIGVGKENVLDILIQLILDGKISGKINEVAGILDLRKAAEKENEKYSVLSTWASGLENMRKTMPQPETRRAGREYIDYSGRFEVALGGFSGRGQLFDAV